MPVVRLRTGTRGSLIAPARARTLSATQRRLHDAARLVVAPDPAVGRGCFPRELRSAHVHGLAQKRLPQGAERRSGDGNAPSARHPARRLHDAPTGEHRADAVARVRRKIQEGPGHDVHRHAGWLDGHGEEPHPMVPLLGGGGDLRRGRRGKRVAPGRELPRRFPLRGPHRVRRVYARPVADVDLVPSLLDHHDQSHGGRADLRAPHGRRLRMAVAPLIVFPDPDSLGPAHLKVAGLELWVHDRRSPKAQDYWEGNWLVVTVRCAAVGATVWTTGPMLRVPDLVRWADALDRLHQRPDGVATLTSDEPNLTAVVRSTDRVGELQLVVDITPDPLTQEHRLRFAVERSALPDLVRQCRAIVKAYPVRDPDGAHDA